MSYIELKGVTKLYSDGNVKAADGVSFSGERERLL